jgi:hypothetical protein
MVYISSSGNEVRTGNGLFQTQACNPLNSFKAEEVIFLWVGIQVIALVA